MSNLVYHPHEHIASEILRQMSITCSPVDIGVDAGSIRLASVEKS